MPCSGYPTFSHLWQFELSGALEEATQVACELLRWVERHDPNIFRRPSESKHPDHVFSKGLYKWVREHKAKDEARIRAEKLERKRKRLKKQAIQKLTKDERAVLGLK